VVVTLTHFICGKLVTWGEQPEVNVKLSAPKWG